MCGLSKNSQDVYHYYDNSTYKPVLVRLDLDFKYEWSYSYERANLTSVQDGAITGCSLSQSEKLLVANSYTTYVTTHDSVWVMNTTDGSLIGAWYYSFNNGLTLFGDGSYNTALILEDDKTIVATFDIYSTGSAIVFVMDISTNPPTIIYAQQINPASDFHKI